MGELHHRPERKFFPFSPTNDGYQPFIKPRDISAQDIQIPVVFASVLAGILLSTAVTSSFQTRARQGDFEANNSTCDDCIFPFIFEGDMYNSCVELYMSGYTICPTRNITTNSFNSSDLFFGVSEDTSNPKTFGYCPQNVGIPTSPLSRDKQDCEVGERVQPLKECRDSCISVRQLNIANAVLVASVAISGGLAILTPLLLGGGGIGKSINMKQ